jgi:DNA repair exonuclease SbcCD ATPase subunit
MQERSKMKKLTKVELENFKGLGKIEIDIRNPSYYIVGKNGTGKTTILQAIWYALQGKYGFGINKKKDRFRFIKEGQKKASATVEIFDTEKNQTVIVERSFSKSKDEVRITTADGQALGVEYLSGLLNHFTYDVHHFARLSPQEQSQMFGIDTAEIDAKIKAARITLSDANKHKLQKMTTYQSHQSEIAQKAADIGQAINDGSGNLKPVDTQELNDKIKSIYAFNAEQKSIEDKAQRIRDKIDDLEQKLIEARQALKEVPTPQPLKDQTAVKTEIEKAQRINAIVDLQKEGEEIQVDMDSAKEAWETHKAIVENLEQEKVGIIKAGKQKIDDAGIDSTKIDFDENGGLMVDGRYLNEDAYNTADLVKKCIMINMLFSKPDFPLFLIRNGGLLDRDDDGTIALFNELESLGAQFICEVVGDTKIHNGILLTQHTTEAKHV